MTTAQTTTTEAFIATSLERDPAINELCPPRRRDDDHMYAQWVLNVTSTLPAGRDAHVTESDQVGWDAWHAEARKVSAWLTAWLTSGTTTPGFTLTLGDEIRPGDEIQGFGVVTAREDDQDYETDMTVTRADGRQISLRTDLEHMVRKPAGTVFIPARDLRKGDVISMGTIAEVDLHDTYVAIDFECRMGKHGTAFPLDLMVTVLSRGPVEVDVSVKLAALVEQLEQLAATYNETASRCRSEAARLHGEDHRDNFLSGQSATLILVAEALRTLVDDRG